MFVALAVGETKKMCTHMTKSFKEFQKGNGRIYSVTLISVSFMLLDAYLQLGRFRLTVLPWKWFG